MADGELQKFNFSRPGRSPGRAGSGMKVQRRETAPPAGSADAVTNSLRFEALRRTVGFFSERPPGYRREGSLLLTQRIFFNTVTSSSFPGLSGFPL